VVDRQLFEKKRSCKMNEERGEGKMKKGLLDKTMRKGTNSKGRNKEGLLGIVRGTDPSIL